MLKDNVLLKEIPRALVFTSNFVFQKLVRRDHLKIFLGVSLAVVVVFRFFVFFFVFFFLYFFFLFCFCSTWKVVCLQFRMFLLFFFLFKISCWDVFFILGVHSFTCSGFINVGFEGF